MKKDVVDGKYKFVFISPESLSMQKYRDILFELSLQGKPVSVRGQ